MEIIHWIVVALGAFSIGVIGGVALQQHLALLDKRDELRFWKLRYKYKGEMAEIYGRWFLEEYEKNKERD